MWNALKLAGYDPSLYRMWDVPPPSNADHAFALLDDLTGDTLTPLTTLKGERQGDWIFRQYLTIRLLRLAFLPARRCDLVRRRVA